MSCDFNVSAYARVSLSYPPPPLRGEVLVRDLGFDLQYDGFAGIPAKCNNSLVGMCPGLPLSAAVRLGAITAVWLQVSAAALQGKNRWMQRRCNHRSTAIGWCSDTAARVLVGAATLRSPQRGYYYYNAHAKERCKKKRNTCIKTKSE